MNENRETEIPDFSHHSRHQIPVEYTWRIEDIYPDMESWNKDKARFKEMMDQIPQLAEGWTSSPQKMLRLWDHVAEIEKIEDKTSCYSRMLSDTDMSDSTWQGMKGEIQTMDIELRRLLAFMDPDILRLGEEKIREYLEAEPKLKIYEMDLITVLRVKDHVLSADKEEIMAQTGLFSGAAARASGVLNDVDIPSSTISLADGQKIKLNVPNFIRIRESNNRKDRIKATQSFWKNRMQYRNTQAVLLDGAVKSHFFNARVRHYPNCLEASLYPNYIDTSVYFNLIDTVRKNLAPLHRFLKLKKRLLNLDKIVYEDIYVSSIPGIERTYPIEEAKRILIDAMSPLGKEYTGVLEKGLNSRWMDIYPNKSKRSGAYSSGSLYDLHPFVLLNYNGSFTHLLTMAHEFGHALHSWFSNKTQPFPLSHYPIIIAEIASTFNETLLVHHLLKNETDDLVKLFIMDRYINEFRGTMFRQTLFAEFEAAIHKEVEQGRTLTTDWMDNCYLELCRFYYGHSEDVLFVPDYIKAEWSIIPHFYYNFYVFKYSTGIAAATALVDIIMQGGEKEKQRYLALLKSGRSKFPLDALSDAGVDLTSPQPIETAIRTFNQVVLQMEEIVDKTGK